MSTGNDAFSYGPAQSWLERYRAATHLDTELEAAGELAGFIAPKLHRYISAFCPRASVDDVLQEALVGIAMGLPRFKGGAPAFTHWAFRIAHNKLANHLELNRRQKLEPMDTEELLKLIDASTQTMPFDFDDRERLDDALRIVTEAKPPCRYYLTQRFVHGIAFKEIGRRMGKTAAAARQQLVRCIGLVREMISKREGTYA